MLHDYSLSPTPPRGFAFSADVVLALILVSSVALLISLPNQPTSFLEERRVADQYVDDIFLAMDHSGFVSSEIDINGFSSATLQNIYSYIRTLLPPQYDLYVELTSYPVDVNSCQSAQDFTTCFPDANRTALTYGTTLPSSAPFVHGRRIFLKQQPSSQCTGGLSPRKSGIYSPYTPSLAFAEDANINFDVNIFPAGPLTCDQNITVSLTVTTNSGTRRPVDMMLVFDRSGSMSWGGQLNSTSALGVEVDQNYAFLADSTSGLRDVNIDSPGLPLLVGTYNSPGTANDVDVNGNYAYLADGSSGLRIVNVTTKSSPSSAAQLDVGGTAYGVTSRDTITYVTTFSSSSQDVETTTNGSPNQNIYIGRTSSQASGGQSFTPGVDFITGFGVRLRKIGSPPDITAHLRTSISGSDLNTITIPASSVGTSSSGAYVDVNFSGVIPLTSGTTYFIVLTTPSNSNSNYYEWKARGSNPYSGGQAYQNTTSQTWDAYLRTQYVAGLVVVDTSTKSSPRVIGASPLEDPYHVTLQGDYAYAANGTNGFRIFNIANPQQPSVVANCYNTGGCNIASGTTYDVWPSGSYAYVGNGSQGMRVVDISNPASPTLVGTYNTPGTAYTVRLKDTNAIIADDSSLQVVNISSPASPVLVDSFATPYSYRDLEVQGDWAYIAVDSGIPGLITIDLRVGPKLNQAKLSANTFIDFNGWNSSNDQLGLVSFSSSATLNQSLTRTYSSVKTSVSNLVASGGTAVGEGINTATTHFSMSQTDVSNSGSQNQSLYIGQNSSNQSAVQSYQPVLPYFTRADVYIRRVGNPASPLVLELRSSISGSPISSVSIPSSSVGTTYALVTANFGTTAVSPGVTYYLAATTATDNASNYYQWGASSSNPYSNGQAYQNTTAQSGWDARFITYGGYSNPSALKFQILMGDGLTNMGANSSTAAITASNNGIIIYTIGFGEDADATELTNIANLTGGQYYYAADQNALSAVYQLIAQTIQVIAQDANIYTSFNSGTVIVDDGNGVLVGNGIIFDINTLAPQPWVSSYTFNIPCTTALACSSTLLSVPGSTTQFQYLDSNGNPQTKDWNEFITTAFNYRDLNVDIQSGNLISTNNVDLTVKVVSHGTLDTNNTNVEFYRGNPSPSTLVGSQSIPFLCGSQSPGCLASSYTFVQNVPAEGDLFAVVNPSGTIPECSNNNQDFIYCYSRPQTQFFTLDYWAWIRG